MVGKSHMASDGTDGITGGDFTGADGPPKPPSARQNVVEVREQINSLLAFSLTAHSVSTSAPLSLPLSITALIVVSPVMSPSTGSVLCMVNPCSPCTTWLRVIPVS